MKRDGKEEQMHPQDAWYKEMVKGLKVGDSVKIHGGYGRVTFAASNWVHVWMDAPISVGVWVHRNGKLEAVFEVSR